MSRVGRLTLAAFAAASAAYTVTVAVTPRPWRSSRRTLRGSLIRTLDQVPAGSIAGARSVSSRPPAVTVATTPAMHASAGQRRRVTIPSEASARCRRATLTLSAGAVRSDLTGAGEGGATNFRAALRCGWVPERVFGAGPPAAGTPRAELP